MNPINETDIEAKLLCNTNENCFGVYWNSENEQFFNCQAPDIIQTGNEHDVLHIKKNLSRKIFYKMLSTLRP